MDSMNKDTLTDSNTEKNDEEKKGCQIRHFGTPDSNFRSIFSMVLFRSLVIHESFDLQANISSE
jgi:hypothetical protein